MNKRNTPMSEQVPMLSKQLRTALQLLIREMRRDTDTQDRRLSLVQMMLLTTIDEHPGSGVGDLARMQNVRSPTISRQIKVLEAAGLLDRGAPQAHDRRRTGVQLTQAGHECLRKLHASRLDWLSQRIVRLTREQIDALAAAIEPLEIISRP
jgi:DNA-binding MarR family transcriptional regulator